MIAEVVQPLTAESREQFEPRQRSLNVLVKQSPNAAQRTALDPQTQLLTTDTSIKSSPRASSPRQAMQPAPRVGLSSALSSNSGRRSQGGSSFIPLGGSMSLAMGNERRLPASRITFGSLNVPVAGSDSKLNFQAVSRAAALEERIGMRPLAEEQAAFPLFKTIASEFPADAQESEHGLVSSKHKLISPKEDKRIVRDEESHEAGNEIIERHTRQLVSSLKHTMEKMPIEFATPPLSNGIASPSAGISTIPGSQRLLEKEVRSDSQREEQLKQGLRSDSQRIHELELAIDKLNRSFQEVNHSLKQQAQEIAIETFSNQIASVRQQVMHEAQLVIKQQANDFLYEALSKPTTSALLQKAFATSPHLSHHIQNVVDDRIRHVATSFVREEVRSLGQEVVGDLGKIADEINAESELRARGINDLNATLRFEVASVRSHVQATRIDLEQADAKARQTNIEELAKLRSMLDSVWSQATQPKENSEGNYYFKFVDPKGNGDETVQYKECVGDTEDINTLYEMVREALGTSTMIRKDLDEERQRRERLQLSLDEERQRRERLSPENSESGKQTRV